MNWATTEDNCGCPLGKTNCVETIGVCDPECYGPEDCAGVTYTCNGNILVETTTAECIKYECVASGGSGDQTDCTSQGRYCLDGADHCVECLEDEHCGGSKIYTGYGCSIDRHNITRQYDETICQFSTGDAWCYAGSPSEETYKTCSPANETCRTQCNKCFDLSTPKHTPTLQTSPYVRISFDIDDRLEIDNTHPPGNYYDFENITIFEFRYGVLVDQSTPGIGCECNPMGHSCYCNWNRNSLPAGNYTYKALVYNRSGKSWLLPNRAAEAYEGFCYGNISHHEP